MNKIIRLLMVGLVETKKVRRIETLIVLNNNLFWNKIVQKKSKKTENKSKPVVKTRTNKEGETFCVGCEEPCSVKSLNSESDHG